MDVVYVNRDGENPELRYSLRSLGNVNHDSVFIFGGAPVWISGNVRFERRLQKASPYSSTRSHIRQACLSSEVSDPFMLWNDDFFATSFVGDVPIMHRGPLTKLLGKTSKTPWAKASHETAVMLSHIDEPLSYDAHYPIIIHKDMMMEALDRVKKAQSDAIHLRTVYGNIAGLGGCYEPDPKLLRRSDPFPTGPWLSSGDNTFRSTVEPVLRFLFPNPCTYEKGQPE